MPQRSKKYTDPMQDGRRKLHPREHQVILRMRKDGLTAREIAAHYEVSISLIKWVLYPKRREAMRERNKLKWKDYALHYGKEGHTRAMRKHRNKKRSLGLLYNADPVQPTEKVCVFCGKRFLGRKNAKYCDPKHRWKVFREKNKKK